MNDSIINLPIPNEPRNTLVMRLRTRRDGQPTYQARRLIPVEQRSNQRNPYRTKSLNTDDFETAKSLAYTWERSLHAKIERGEPLDRIVFRNVAADYIKWATRRVETLDRNGRPLMKANALRREESCLRRYLVPFFGEKDIRSIGLEDIDNFLEWRNDYYIDGPGATEATVEFTRLGEKYQRPAVRSDRPSKSTINKDAVAFSKVIKHGRRAFGISDRSIPRISLPRRQHEPNNRRPRFNDEEWLLLSETAIERCVMATGHTRFYRHVLWGLLELLYGTGLRVSEAMWLQRRHLVLYPVTEKNQKSWDEGPDEWENEDGTLGFAATSFPVIDGKLMELRVVVSPDNQGLKQADHARTVIPTRNFSEVFAHHMGFISEQLHGFGDWFSMPDDQFLFPKPDGERIGSMRRAFEKLLAASVSSESPNGLKLKDGRPRTLGSIRHTYASKQIETGATRDGLGFLADNMGTSTEMIRKHYGQVLRELRADDLQGF